MASCFGADKDDEERQARRESVHGLLADDDGEIDSPGIEVRHSSIVWTVLNNTCSGS